MAKNIIDLEKGELKRIRDRNDLLLELGELIKIKNAMVEIGDDTTEIDAEIQAKKDEINNL